MEYKSLVIFFSIALFGILETVFPFFQYRQSGLKIFSTNLILGLINALAVNLTIAWFLKWVWQQKLWLGFFHDINLPWVSLILSFLLLDLYMYAWHRFLHNWQLGWRFHLVHHTDCWINISTAYRFHTIEVIVSNFPKFLLIYIFGIQTSYLLIYESLFAISLVFHHSNLALPLKWDKFLSYVIVTPNYHRAHHSQLIQATNSNYSSLLTIWDMLFQTRYYPRFPGAIQLGLPQENRDFNFINLWKLPFVKR
ncbi:sterol desaturase family protein [Anabaena sphaerica FACHB-251]|uniref:Sterol desaturase family protein n=1 Tax=Anabaena sphaerica FACHB-251 TaxID=2692883 RepID=A0A926WFA3_9NOST|nr:sterol desaturase family protein [Anabaena sphaerica]MBD2293499.1 sterol desaturase family protein [Anabaena sphaerica FACHB-251]